MTQRASPSLGAALVRSIAAALLVGLACGGPAGAASAPPSVMPGDPNIEAWLDEPFVPDAPAGATIGTGVTMWDRANQTLFDISDAYVILRPAAGKATPSETRARSDWPGHLAFEIAIPTGGPGKLEVGFEGQTCDAAGNNCTTARFPFAFGGIGPPPDVPRSSLVVATIHDIAEPVVAGEPIDVIVDVEPQAAWGLDSLGLPDHLVVVASERAGVRESKADLPRTNDGGTHGLTYSGQITLGEAGNITLIAAFPGQGTQPDDVLERSVIRVTVAAGDAGSPGPRSSGAPVAPAAPELSWLWIAVAALVVVGGVVVSKAFADL